MYPSVCHQVICIRFGAGWCHLGKMTASLPGHMKNTGGKYFIDYLITTISVLIEMLLIMTFLPWIKDSDGYCAKAGLPEDFLRHFEILIAEWKETRHIFQNDLNGQILTPWTHWHWSRHAVHRWYETTCEHLRQVSYQVIDTFSQMSRQCLFPGFIHHPSAVEIPGVGMVIIRMKGDVLPWSWWLPSQSSVNRIISNM